MKSLKFLSLVAAALLISVAAHAADDACGVCPQVKDLLKRMDKTAPDPMNGETIRQQNSLIEESIQILKTGLTTKNFTAASARPLVKLIVKTMPYDNSMTFVQIHIGAFQNLYKQPNSLLKSTIDEMQKSGEISTADKSEMLEDFGISGMKAAKSKK